MEKAPSRGKCHYSEIDAHALTEGYADVAAQVPALLGQADGQLTSATADDFRVVNPRMRRR